MDYHLDGETFAEWLPGRDEHFIPLQTTGVILRLLDEGEQQEGAEAILT